MVILRQQSVPPIYATCFSKRTAILQQKCEGECNITLKWSFTYAKPLWIQHTIPLKNAFVCLRKLCSTYIQCLYKKKVLHRGALPYLSGLILIYPPPRKKTKQNKDFATSPETRASVFLLLPHFIWFFHFSSSQPLSSLSFFFASAHLLSFIYFVLVTTALPISSRVSTISFALCSSQWVAPSVVNHTTPKNMARISGRPS